MKKILLAFIMLGLVAYATAENLPIKGKCANGEVFLRWAVENVSLWRKAQHQGFLVERFSTETVLWNGKIRNDSVRDKSWIVRPYSIDDTAVW
ncbi:MAG: hypothetical protein LBF01_01970, partial [Bacteroidales bacterium]|nr:hypothetical protein [Bacteroidales bacterium]